MTSLAIDFGSRYTKVAIFDSSIGEPRLIGLETISIPALPSILHVAADGAIQIGAAAEQMALTDPGGIVRGTKIKWDLVKPALLRPNGRRISRPDLVRHLMAYIRERCQEQVPIADSIASCRLTVPAVFDTAQRSALRAATLEAGFSSVCEIDEPLAAVKHWLLHNPSEAKNIAVCDLGANRTSFSLVSRRGPQLRLHANLPTRLFRLGCDDVDHAICDDICVTRSRDLGTEEMAKLLSQIRSIKEGHSCGETPFSAAGGLLAIETALIDKCLDEFAERIVLDLRHCFAEIKTLGIVDVPLLLVGGGAKVSRVYVAIAKEYSLGPIACCRDSEFAAVLGAVEIPESAVLAISCPECKAKVPPKRRACPNCGFPIANVKEVVANVASRRNPAETKGDRPVICPECKQKVPAARPICGNCGYPIYK